MLKILLLIILSNSSIQFQKDYRIKDGWNGSPLPIYSGLHYSITNKDTDRYLSSSASMVTYQELEYRNEAYWHIFDEMPVISKQNDCKYEIKSRNWTISFCITTHRDHGYYRSNF